MKRVKICYMILGGAVPLLNAAAGSPIWVLERDKRYEWVRGKRLIKKNSTRNRLVPIFLSLVPDRDAFQLRLEEFLSLLPPEARRRKGVLYVVLPYGVRTEEGSGVWKPGYKRFGLFWDTSKHEPYDEMEWWRKHALHREEDPYPLDARLVPPDLSKIPDDTLDDWIMEALEGSDSGWMSTYAITNKILGVASASGLSLATVRARIFALYNFGFLDKHNSATGGLWRIVQ